MKGVKPPKIKDEYITMFGQPKNWDEARDGECYGLPVVRTNVTLVSCWRMSLLERLQAFFTGHIWLSIYGSQQPAVSLSVKPLAKNPKEKCVDGDQSDQKDERS